MNYSNFSEVRADLIEKINQIQDPKTGYNFNVDPNDPSDIVAIIVNFLSLKLTEIYDELIRLRACLNPFKATGPELRDVMSYRGLTPKIGTPTTTTLHIQGVSGAHVPQGVKVKNKEGDKVFETIRDCELDAEGSVYVPAQCTINGTIALSADELTEFVEPINGVLSVTNDAGQTGSNDETDQEIHMRLSEDISTLGKGFLEILDTVIKNVDGVISATTYVGKDDDKGLNSGEICSVVRGGDDTAVATAIYKNNMFLYKYVGNTTVNIFSQILNQKQEVKFQRPTEDNVSISLTIVPIGSVLPDNYKDILFQNTLKFVDQYSPNQTVYMSDLATFLNSLNVCKIVTCKINNGDRFVIAWNKIINLLQESFSCEVSA